jgi:GTP-binding protein
VDTVEIEIRAGDGGDGIVSFRHEKYVPFGGPDGGDGGAGGNVYMIAENKITDLSAFRQKRKFKAASGDPGGKQKRFGANGADLEIAVPLGTLVYVREGNQDALIADLKEHGRRILLARGGKGGLGNVHFASPRNKVPKKATKGEPGESKRLVLDMRLIADIGIIGKPNVGKSTFLAAVTQAKPKIAEYPFTTRYPVLGVVDIGMKTYVLAEIPGLIEDAHLGKGLGHSFLRHVERTKVLLHLLDGVSETVVDDMYRLNQELTRYKDLLAEKRQVVAVNKIDLPEVRDRIPELSRQFNAIGMEVFFISAETKQGLLELLTVLAQRVDEADEEMAMDDTPEFIFRPKPKSRKKQ